jgi:folate-binding protein YgfZ
VWAKRGLLFGSLLVATLVIALLVVVPLFKASAHTADRSAGLPYPAGMSRNLSATPIQRDVVIITGADAPEYLQTQLSQDVLSLDRGRSRWTFILTSKSEIEAMVRVTRTSDGFVLDTATGHGDRIRQRLDGPLFRMDVTFDQDTWPGVAWRGEGADAFKGDAPIVAEMPWSGVGAVDEIGPDVRVPADVTALTSDELDALRIGANWPAEAEIDGKATPAMTGIVEDTVSFEKGCYTGQEFVARVHYRDAAPPRQLVQITFEPGADVAAGAEMVVGGEPVGTVTSSVSALGVSLGYCKRSVSLPAEGVVGSTAVALS